MHSNSCCYDIAFVWFWKLNYVKYKQKLHQIESNKILFGKVSENSRFFFSIFELTLSLFCNVSWAKAAILLDFFMDTIWKVRKKFSIEVLWTNPTSPNDTRRNISTFYTKLIYSKLNWWSIEFPEQNERKSQLFSIHITSRIPNRMFASEQQDAP